VGCCYFEINPQFNLRVDDDSCSKNELLSSSLLKLQIRFVMFGLLDGYTAMVDGMKKLKSCLDNYFWLRVN